MSPELTSEYILTIGGSLILLFVVAVTVLSFIGILRRRQMTPPRHQLRPLFSDEIS